MQAMIASQLAAGAALMAQKLISIIEETATWALILAQEAPVVELLSRPSARAIIFGALTEAEMSSAIADSTPSPMRVVETSASAFIARMRQSVDRWLISYHALK